MESEPTYGFVILHYLAGKMTEKCVQNLLDRFGRENIHITVVDNASPNGSGEELSLKFEENPQVMVLRNRENLGFAKGNNIGYLFELQNFDPDYLIVMNNDVLIEQDDFLQKVDAIYQKTPFAVLGPDVYSTSRMYHQNPYMQGVITPEELEGKIRYVQERLNDPRKTYLKDTLRETVRGNRAIRSVGHAIKYHNKTENWTIAREGVTLHGACLIFSRDFMDANPDYCFCPDTFLYMEEDILAWQCQKKQLRTYYCPEIHVKHLEDVSTNMLSGSGLQKYVRKYREVLKSCGVLKKLMDRDARDSDAQDRDAQDSDAQNRDAQDRDEQDSDAQDIDMQEKNGQT
ncbi:MAG: glycosyltransferase [Eubacteriales bacterium]|jgi:GT2 family glycosyltransferase